MTRRIELILIIVGWLMLPAQLLAVPAQSSNYDPAQHGPSKRHAGFIEFALDRINPTNIDYGQLLEEDRHVALRTTLESMYFRLMVVSSGAAILFFCWLLHCARLRERQEIVAARFLSWYHNELVHAQEAAIEAIRRHEQLRRFIDGERAYKDTVHGPGRLTDISTSPADSRAPVAPDAGINERPVADSSQASAPDASSDIVKNMQMQIVRLQRQLADERQKNRKLKGE